MMRLHTITLLVVQLHLHRIHTGTGIRYRRRGPATGGAGEERCTVTADDSCWGTGDVGIAEAVGE